MFGACLELEDVYLHCSYIYLQIHLAGFPVCIGGLSFPVYVTGLYFSGDGAHRDVDGYYQIVGRMDDVINISGHRLGTAEVEDVMVRAK